MTQKHLDSAGCGVFFLRSNLDFYEYAIDCAAKEEEEWQRELDACLECWREEEERLRQEERLREEEQLQAECNRYIDEEDSLINSV